MFSYSHQRYYVIAYGGTGDGLALIGVGKDYLMLPVDTGDGRAECIKRNHWTMGFREGRGASDRAGQS